MRVRKRITRYSTLILINRVRLPSYRSPPLPRPLRTRCILHSSVPCKTKEKTAFKLRSLSARLSRCTSIGSYRTCTVPCSTIYNFCQNYGATRCDLNMTAASGVAHAPAPQAEELDTGSVPQPLWAHPSRSNSTLQQSSLSSSSGGPISVM